MRPTIIELSLDKTEGEDVITISKDDTVIETINYNESINFKGVIEELLNNNFENEYAISDDNAGGRSEIEKDAKDFLSRIIDAYNKKVAEWRKYREEFEQDDAGVTGQVSDTEHVPEP